MKVTYAKDFYPMAECIDLLKQYVEKKAYTSDRLYALDEQNTHLQERGLALLDEMKDQMGAVLDAQFSNHAYLFKSVFPDDASIAKAILRDSFDFQIFAIQKQKEHVLDLIDKDQLHILRCFMSTLISDESYIHTDLEVMLQQLDENDLDDDHKWKLTYCYLQSKQTVEQLFAILEKVVPIYESFHVRLQEFLVYYKQEQLKEYAEKDMFLHLIAVQHYDIGEHQAVYLVPSLSAYRSLELRFDRDNEDHSLFVQWGVGVLKGIEKDKRQLTPQALCDGLKLLSDSSKFEIMRYLYHHRAYGAELAKELHLTTATITYHMQALLNANFVHFEKENNRVYYQVERDNLDEFFNQTIKQLKE